MSKNQCRDPLQSMTSPNKSVRLLSGNRMAGLARIRLLSSIETTIFIALDAGIKLFLIFISSDGACVKKAVYLTAKVD